MQDLILGKEYTLTFKNEVPGISGANRKIKKKLKLIGKYRNHALFMDKNGLRESFTYWELRRCLKCYE